MFADSLQEIIQQVGGRHSRGVPLELGQDVDLPLLDYTYRQSTLFLTTSSTSIFNECNPTDFSTDFNRRYRAMIQICSGRIKNH